MTDDPGEQTSYLAILDDYVGLGEVGDLDSIRARLARQSLDRIAELCALLSINLPRPQRNDGLHRFVANSAMSGLPHPCSAFQCRSDNLSVAANFTAIYANETVLFSPFRDLAVRAARGQRQNSKRDIRDEVSFYVSEVLMLRPLIDRGMLKFEDEDDERYCRNCTQKALEVMVRGSASDLNQNGLYFDFIEHFANNTLVFMEGRKGRRGTFLIEGSPDMAAHGKSYYETSISDDFRNIPNGQLLNKEQVFKSGVAENFAHYAGNDIVAASAISENFNIKNLIGGSRQLSILKDYFGESKFSKSIDIHYPLLSRNSIENVLSFRDNEWHHLHDFRTMVEDGIASGQNVSAELLNSSAKIQNIVNKNKLSSDREILKQAAISATMITATVVSSGFSGIVAAAIGALGAGHFAKDMIPKLIDRFSEPVALRDQTSYYAWKIRQSDLLEPTVRH